MSGPLKFVRQKQALLYSFKSRCAWCRRPVIYVPRLCGAFSTYDAESLPFMASCDHWVLHSKGGSNCTENMILACAECNTERGDRDFDVWHAIMTKRGLNPLSKNRIRRKAKFAGILHRYMGDRDMPLYAAAQAVHELKERERQFCQRA